MSRFVAVALAAVFAVAPIRAQAPDSLSDSVFARLSAALSEPEGYFNTDNLISNEDSYLHVVGTLKRLGVTGGVYLGVGPDQNFSYIAAIRPRIAFIIDIRRDNLLEHQLFKAIFALSRNRLEFMCLLFGRPAPADTAGWGARDIAALLAYIDQTKPSSEAGARAQARVVERARRSPLTLSPDDIATVTRFHQTFMRAGPNLIFNTTGRAPQPYYPDLRRLLTETDLTGRQSNYLAHEADFQVVKSLQAKNLIVPVVGNFVGPKALAAVGQWVRDHRETVSAFYTSNVEEYIFNQYSRFAETVSAFPRTPRSVMLRSFFRGGHPNAVPGYHATQLAQFIDRFTAAHAAGGFTSYFTLVTRDVITP